MPSRLKIEATTPETSTSKNQNKMAGDHVDESQFKGLSRYFNSQTMTGRANVAKATYATVGLLILYLTLKPKKKQVSA